MLLIIYLVCHLYWSPTQTSKSETQRNRRQLCNVLKAFLLLALLNSTSFALHQWMTRSDTKPTRTRLAPVRSKSITIWLTAETLKPTAPQKHFVEVAVRQILIMHNETCSKPVNNYPTQLPHTKPYDPLIHKRIRNFWLTQGIRHPGWKTRGKPDGPVGRGKVERRGNTDLRSCGCHAATITSGLTFERTENHTTAETGRLETRSR